MVYLEDRSYHVTACDGLVDLDGHLMNQKRTDSVVGHKHAGPAVHMAVRLSRIGCPVRTVRSQRGPEHYRCLAVPKIDKTLAELGRSNHHRCSNLHAVIVAARPHVVHW